MSLLLKLTMLILNYFSYKDTYNLIIFDFDEDMIYNDLYYRPTKPQKKITEIRSSPLLVRKCASAHLFQNKKRRFYNDICTVYHNKGK